MNQGNSSLQHSQNMSQDNNKDVATPVEANKLESTNIVNHEIQQ